MWNQRYSEDGYAYGTQPNDFLREHAGELSGPVLSLCEGEGRNGVFLAAMGLEVTGVDGSEVGLAKARALAASRGVALTTVVADLAEFEAAPESFGAVVSIFAHLPPEIRRAVHRRAVGWLRPGGIVLLEAYTPAQVGRGTGGPPDPAMCMTVETLRDEFAGLEIMLARETERTVVEGRCHTGEASVVQFMARKPGG